MKVLVVGGNGFLGRSLIKKLVDRDHEVVVMDVAVIPDLFQPFGDAVRVVRGDVTQFDEVMEVMQASAPDRAVNLSYHLASDVPPHRALKLNIVGMDNFFEAARLSRIPHTIYASSFIVNGDQRYFGERPINEDDHLYGEDQYSVHKGFNEWQARDYCEKYGMTITGFRPANITGFDKVHGSMDHVRCVVLPARGEAVTFGYKQAVWCPIHMEDASEALTRIVLAEKPRHRIYNTGGTAIRMGELADIVRSFLPDAQISFRHETGGEHSNPINYLIDNTRIVEEFGLSYPPFRLRVLQIINDVRRSAGLPVLEAA